MRKTVVEQSGNRTSSPQGLVPFERINSERVLFGIDEIKKFVPHRHEMLQIDRIVEFNPDKGYAVGIKELRKDEFWVRGHIPGRPIMPGVLFIEAAAQMCTFHSCKTIAPDSDKFFGLAKLEGVRFRGKAAPGDSVVILVKLIKQKRIAAVYDTQAFVEGKLIFEARIIGAAV